MAMATFSPSSIFSPLSIITRRPALPLINLLPTHRSSKAFRPKTLRCISQKPATEEFERLFSNLNQASMKREPGSVSSAIFLVAGTTVGAGILAIPAVTQEAGFLASAVTCTLCWIYMVVTGLLIAEVNVNTMCELGSGGVSLVSMAMRTLGRVGVQVSCWSYLFIHYALLVAYVARSSDILTNSFGIPLWESAILFSLVFGGICYFGILFLTTFLCLVLKLPSGESKPLPYLLTLVPPVILALLDPEIFFKALDFAGTYGVLVLFGVLPGAMSWSERYSASSSSSSRVPPLVPGGKGTLTIVMGGALLVIFSELLRNVIH
ncbi:hypothetical protein AXF42_Ash008606 [Apostasia shenzhenica]|uniref:Tyrosine-specific transport protein n=1 Tax=Apostasia shenzhenica TaxID=1088818 RepID=A0A2I0B1W2_9ASPA|nr:hypothetical protein AXF42_Ash008606 [Apostasia shenzhenica]